jgi:hypothetical protein
MTKNTLSPTFKANPSEGKLHEFFAYQLPGPGTSQVAMAPEGLARRGQDEFEEGN